VEYKTREEALKAKHRLDGTMLLGRELRVRFSEEKVAIGNTGEDAAAAEKESSGDAETAALADEEYTLEMKMEVLRQRLGIQQQEGGTKKQKNSATTFSTTASAEPGAPARGKGRVKPAWMVKQEKEKEQQQKEAEQSTAGKTEPLTDLDRLTAE
jgi:hypothetical protein